MSEYVSSEGLNCKLCGKPLDTITTKTMLCKKCRGKEWSANAHAMFKEKYGIDNPMQDRSMVDKIQKTMQERYGTNCAMNVPEFRKKFEDTCNERYGTSYYVNYEGFVNKSSCKSKVNEKFAQLLSKHDIEFQVEQRRDDKRFDFELKQSKTYVEIDPTYTHNAAGNHWDEEGLPKDQQLVKTLIAEKYGYRCIHVFDWDSWEDIIELISPKVRIYGRRCLVKEITDKSYDSFIDENHLQKNCKGTTVAIGLYLGEELVQVMTFGKPRYNKNYRWELLRLCSKKGYSVIGGASKLFNYATNVLKLDSIVSYCDRSKFSGSVYTQIGMKLTNQTEPQQVWSKGNKKITGWLLRQRGYDQLFNANYGKGTSNEELMLRDGWLPVYDCGQLVFTYGDKISDSQLQSNHTDDINYADVLKSIEKTKEKLCAFCGEPFIPASNFQRYCKRPHYMTCPVCGKQYLVTNNENLKRPPVACSYECRSARTRQTSLEKYGVTAPGNNPEARKKCKETYRKNYGADHPMQNEKFKKQIEGIMLDKYGVKNIRMLDEQIKADIETRNKAWEIKKHDNFPMKLLQDDSPHTCPFDEEEMIIHKLTEKASQSFLSQNGFRISTKFGKIHLSFGLVKDNMLYQVIRFERCKDKIILADFGTRQLYYNPKGYSKLINYATTQFGIDEFEAYIPRNIATDSVIESLKLIKESECDYDVFWIIDNEYRELKRWDNISEMKLKYDYVTSDYIDKYSFRA